MNLGTADNPSIVYHYTSLDGFIGIVKSQCVHATAIDYLNDIQEQRILLEHAESELRHSIQYPGISGETLRALIASREADVADSPLPLIRPFVASFSSLHDSLPQWRSYCANGNGVCIGFPTATLKKAYLSSNGRPDGQRVPLWAREVTYVQEGDEAMLTAKVRFCYEWAKQVLQEHPDLVGASHANLDLIFARLLDSQAPFFKHHSFQAESEWRLSVSSSYEVLSCIGFKTKRTTLVPYVPLLLPTHADGSSASLESIASVTVGPTPNMKLSLESVRCFMTSMGLRAEVKPSKAPYREW